MNRQLFLHQPGHTETQLIEVDESMSVEELNARHGQDGHGAYAQDGDELIVSELVINVVEERHHIYIGPKGEVHLTVRYETGDKDKEFGPGTRVQTVLDWAVGKDGFNVPESQRGGLGLFVPGSKDPLDPAEHIGVLAKDHRLSLVLAPVIRPQG